MTRAVLITGSNMGDSAATLDTARTLIAEGVGDIVACSEIMASEPWGDMAPEANDFANQVLVVDTHLPPVELLAATQDIEKILGRTRTGDEPNGKHDARKYESRPIDIDILFYGDTVINTPELTVPHPLIQRREFVLRPLAQALPGFRDPVTGKSAEQMLEELKTANTLTEHDNE